MIESMDEYLVGFVVGVRYRPNFSVEDQLGRIIDEVLYGKDAFFNPSVFPVATGGLNEKALMNEQTGDHLKISNSSIILDVRIPATFQLVDVSRVLENFDKQIIHGMMQKFAIREIGRVGFIKRYLVKIKDLADSFVDKTIGKTLEGVNDINLRFSKKLPAQASLVQERVNDFLNSIFTIIKKADSDEIFISVDYQRYYNPALSSAADMNFRYFIGEADAFTQKRCLPWLNQNYLEAKTP